MPFRFLKKDRKIFPAYTHGFIPGIYTRAFSSLCVESKSPCHAVCTSPVADLCLTLFSKTALELACSISTVHDNATFGMTAVQALGQEMLLEICSVAV